MPRAFTTGGGENGRRESLARFPPGAFTTSEDGDHIESHPAKRTLATPSHFCGYNAPFRRSGPSLRRPLSAARVCNLHLRLPGEDGLRTALCLPGMSCLTLDDLRRRITEFPIRTRSYYGIHRPHGEGWSPSPSLVASITMPPDPRSLSPIHLPQIARTNTPQQVANRLDACVPDSESDSLAGFAPFPRRVLI
jgi:hypothetical protein